MQQTGKEFVDPNFEFDKTISTEEWDIIDELRKKGYGRNTKEKREKFDGRLQEYLDSLSPSESYASVLRMALKKNIASDILRSFLSFKNKSANKDSILLLPTLWRMRHSEAS